MILWFHNPVKCQTGYIIIWDYVWSRFCPGCHNWWKAKLQFSIFLKIIIYLQSLNVQTWSYKSSDKGNIFPLRAVESFWEMGTTHIAFVCRTGSQIFTRKPCSDFCSRHTNLSDLHQSVPWLLTLALKSNSRLSLSTAWRKQVEANYFSLFSSSDLILQEVWHVFPGIESSSFSLC